MLEYIPDSPVPPPPSPLDSDIELRRATPDDLARVTAVVHDATRRMQEKGFHMWRLYLTEVGAAQIRRRVFGDGGAAAYLATRRADGCDVGVFGLEWSDPEIWGDVRGNDGRAGYVHMLAVHRIARGTGLGERLLRHAESLIAARGRPLFRLDCWRGSEFLKSFYPRVGFTVVGEDPVQGVLLWEKPVGVVT